MSSIADKFKRILPVTSGKVSMRADSAAALSFDSIETVQTPEEKTTFVHREVTPEQPAFTADGGPATEASAPRASEQAVPIEAPVVEPSPARAVRAKRLRRSQRSAPARQQRILAMALAGVVLLLLLVAGSAILRAERLAQQVAATGQSLMQSQRLAKSVSQALVGNVGAFAEVKESSDDLTRRVQGLASGDDSLKLERVGNQYEAELAKITPLVERADKSAKAVLAQQKKGGFGVG